MKIVKSSDLKDFSKGDPTKWVVEADNDLGNIINVLQGRVRLEWKY